MPPTNTFPLVDRLIPGGLAAFLAEARERGESYAIIAARLADEHDINVDRSTVRNWCQQEPA